MEILCSAVVFFSIVFLAGKFFGQAGQNVAMGCLIGGSLALIASLPILAYLFLSVVVPML